MRHTWINRTAPVLVGVTVIGCAWYSISSQPKPLAVIPTPAAHAASPPGSVDSSIATGPVADFAPTVSKLGAQVQFSLPAAKLQNVQKVEFYIEHTLVGAAFSAPYQVSVSEDNLTAGTHSVTAKVYTDSTTTQTTPALFTASPNPGQRTAESSPEKDTDSPGAGTASPADGTTALAAPTQLVASAGADGVSAQLSWTASSGAASYQIWRDGSQVATAADTAFTDTGLAVGQTYDYSVVAVNGDLQSDPSDQVGVTMPLPPTPPHVSDPVNSHQDDSAHSTDDQSSFGGDQDLPLPEPLG